MHSGAHADEPRVGSEPEPAAGDLPRSLEQLFEVPDGEKDNHGNEIRKGADPKTGWPLEIRHKECGMHLVFIPQGNFEMGSEEGGKDEKPVHEVIISHPFYAGKYEVTVAEFKIFVQDTGHNSDQEADDGRWVYTVTGGLYGWESKPDANWRNPYFTQTDEDPVVLVSWNDCQKVLHWLNGMAEGGMFRFPTEAEWEYMARAGSKTKFFWGDGVSEIVQYANTLDRAAKVKFSGLTWAPDYDDGHGVTAPVGRFKPNAYGLYDIAGNVWEWCQDYGRLYKPGSWNNPIGSDPWYRSIRGGSWSNKADCALSAYRGGNTGTNRRDDAGFRVIFVPSKNR